MCTETVTSLLERSFECLKEVQVWNNEMSKTMMDVAGTVTEDHVYTIMQEANDVFLKLVQFEHELRVHAKDLNSQLKKRPAAKGKKDQ